MVKLHRIKNEKGQLLIEAMVAVSLMLVGLMGIFGVLSRSLGLSRVAADHFVAVNLASEVIEIAKNILDKNFTAPGGGVSWNDGFPDGTYCVDYQNDSLVSCPGAEDKKLYVNSDGLHEHDTSNNTRSKFSRSLTVITSPTGNMIAVQSKVTWVGKGGPNSSVTVEDHFYNWRVG